jgi:hypothetical protein
VSDNLVRYRGCDCMGTSSGPREVIVNGPNGKRRLVRVAFACDVCDAPWSNWMEPPPPDLTSTHP